MLLLLPRQHRGEDYRQVEKQKGPITGSRISNLPPGVLRVIGASSHQISWKMRNSCSRQGAEVLPGRAIGPPTNRMWIADTPH